MSTLTFLQHADLVTTVGVNSAILCISFTAHRRTRMSASAFWFVAATMSIVMSVGLHTYAYSHPPSSQEYRSFMVFYRADYIIQAVLAGAGCILLTSYTLAKLKPSVTPNVPPPPSVADPRERSAEAKPKPPATPPPSPGGF